MSVRTPSCQLISIHALREEGDLPDVSALWRCTISIHALREEGDRAYRRVGLALSNFYPRPPRGGRRTAQLKKRQTVRISIHALREEGDKTPRLWYTRGDISIHALREEGDPQATPSASDRLISIHALREEGDAWRWLMVTFTVKFLSTPSARRATAKTETKSLFSYKLYNILHEFRRALIYNGSKNYPNHAK